MKDISHTIAEYEESCKALRGRINQLSDCISGRVPLGEEASVRALEKRRYQLYMELAEMQYAMFSLGEYLGEARQGEGK